MPSAFEVSYPAVARWVKDIGWIELGFDGMSPSFVRALDIGGLIWEGGDWDDALDVTLRKLDIALERWIKEQLDGR